MTGNIDFDLTEHTCERCGEVWFSYYAPKEAQPDPNFCPNCGMKFTTTNGELRE